MKTDFLVIGGGIAGVSVGARLSHLGRVTLLEGEAGLGYHASGRSAALFDECLGAPEVVALNRASHPYHATENGGVLSDRGLMVVGRTEDAALFTADRAHMRLTPLTVDEARAMMPVLNPDTVAFAGLNENAWDLDTDLLIQNFAREIRANGGTVQTRQQVQTITRDAAGWQVQTGKETFQGRVLVNAAGAWVDVVARMAGVAPLGFTPMRRSMARLPAPGGHDLNRWPMVVGAGERWYCKPDAGKLLVSPAEEDPQDPHDAFADDMILAEGLARYEEMVTEPVTRLETSWAGLRTFAPDRLLVIGFDPAESTFFWHAGQGGVGFQTAPAASQLAADIVAERTPEIGADLARAFSPARFA
ncbi:NAD(P)/FAD-dependent oxidoreductase [Rhodovulum adriaticum]|uniref:Glycine/D-amino acid oxidase-like deaminating enzyme n=1 Tax=Rhodovulum adriaticum TaxID=35804 RepID=A0A4R2NWP4_RHOAD|nr:FAD-binding oxidoreductase [Rhodovulum adriaticum]MBK1636236.1 glycerol-3-phosphate dehydrogenase [Rhodovulum adriaticum]TCP26510.1 glycine/D-amino acid oxidase-like deaminating enzyme [Rhodovulum adriaticum]